MQTNRITELESTNFLGSLLWKVHIPEDQTQSLTSPAFYTGSPGYKVRVVFKLRGLSDGDVSYASTTIIPEEGMFDDRLQFPCQGVCCITVFTGADQNREHIHYATNILSPGRAVSGDPSGENEQYGQFKFLKTHDLLEMSKFFDGHLFLQLDVHHFLSTNVGF